MKYWLILFLLFTWNVQAEPPVFIYDKPNIPVDKILNAQEQGQVKAALHRDRNLIFKELIPAKNDYIDDYDRGTVYFNLTKGINYFGREVFEASNYSFHKVIIPDGTTITGANFSQKEFDTDAIKGNNLIFKNCNLTNVLIHSSWTLISCNTTQRKEEVIGNEIIIYNRDKQNKWIEVEHEIIIP